MSIASTIIRDLISDTDPWWDSELETVTGFTRADYEELLTRVSVDEYSASAMDKSMLCYAANNLLGYPGIQTKNVEQELGVAWQRLVQDFLTMMKGDE